MKNSKFIQSSKDKLSRSFNPSKCKTSLRLAASRSKLLRNRKENPLKQMKKETAHLLQSGQDQAALIRVEHVIREEKMIAAFELIEIYCELIIARLPLIEAQRNCPIDLKEAIASIVFASPRCGDVPELLDVRKHFTAKYGKDFTAAAIELRPTCGVGRLMVEKLSASAPDAQTKIKILTAIAEEHNVKWDHKPLEEKDTVTPPSTSGSASKPYVKPSRYVPDVQAPQSNTLHGSQSSPSRQDNKTSPQTDNPTPSQTSSSSTWFQRNESPPHRQSEPHVEPSRDDPYAQASQINTMHDTPTNFSHQDTKTSPQTSNLTSSQTSSSSTGFQHNESPPHRQSQPYVEPSCYPPDAQAPQINTMHDSQSNSTHQDTKTSPQTANLTPSQISISGTGFQHNESPPHRQSQPYVAPSHYSPDAQAPQINTMHDSQLNSHEDTKTSPQTENLIPPQASSSSTSFHSDESPPDRQSLTMEFKDATSATKEAAESAELASMTAKASAELGNDSRIMKQDTSESRESEVYVSKDEVPSYLITKNTSENISEERIDTTLQNEKIDGIVEDHLKTSGLVDNGYTDLRDYSQSVSLNSKFSIEEDLLDHSVPVQDVYSQIDSLKQEAESPNEWPEGPETVREERVSSKQQSFKSSPSNSSVSDDLNTFSNSKHPKSDYDADNNFVHGDVVGEVSAFVHFDDKFDSDGEDHRFNIGTKYDEPESESHLPLPSHNSTGLSSSINDSHDPEYSSSKIVDSTPSLFTTENSSSEFSENLTLVNDMEQDNLKAFDDVDGTISESDEEIIILESKPNQIGQLKDDSGSTSEEEDYSGIHNEHLSLSTNHESDSMRTSQEKGSYADSSEEFSLKNSRVDVVEPNDFVEELELSSHNAVGLDFGNLTGGLKHKGYNTPLFLKTQLGGSSPPKEENGSSTVISTVQSAVEIESSGRSKVVDNKNRARTTAPESDSDSDSSEEEVSLRKGTGQKLKIQKLRAGKDIKPKLDTGSLNSNFGFDDSDLDEDVLKEPLPMKTLLRGGISLNSTFGSDDSDLDEDVPKEPLPRKTTPLRGGISRRTKASSRKSDTSTSKTSLGSDALASDDNMDKNPKSPYISDIPIDVELKNEQESRLRSDALASDDDVDRKPKSSYVSDIPKEFELENEWETKLIFDGLDSDDDIDRKTKSSSIPDIPVKFETKNKQEIFEQPASPKPAPKPAKSNFWGPPEPYVPKFFPVTKQEDSPKTETPNKTDPKDDSSKRASHVHPKLPDYDSLLQSLRVNRS